MNEVVVRRKTRETDITIKFKLYGKGEYHIDTPYKFFNHLLSELTYYALFDLNVKASGDLAHHVIEDVGICLGDALRRSFDELKNIKRFGFSVTPMDDALVIVSVDLAKRPFFSYKLELSRDIIEDTSVEDIIHFLKSFTDHGIFNLHVIQMSGSNNHHVLEATFKGLGQALRMAVSIDEKRTGVTSTKGSL